MKQSHFLTLKTISILTSSAILVNILLLSSCSTYIRIPVVATMPANFMQTMKGGKKVGIIAVPPQTNSQLSEFGDMTSIIQGVAENAFRAYRYFTIVDISSRAQRMQEIALSQTGATNEQRQIGQEMSINAFLYIEVPNPPQAECKQSSRQETRNVCAQYDSNRKCLKYNTHFVNISNATLTVKVAVKGRLVNIETGRTLTYTASNMGGQTMNNNLMRSFTGNGQYINEVENGIASCPSVLAAFEKEVNKAAQDLAANLSPKVIDYAVIIEDDLAGTPADAKEEVKAQLKMAINWLNNANPNLDSAYDNWNQALNLSGNQSLAALWNIAVYYWSMGDLDQAEKYFNQVKLNPNFFNSQKMENYNRFVEEKKRRQLESSSVFIRFVGFFY